MRKIIADVFWTQLNINRCRFLFLVVLGVTSAGLCFAEGRRVEIGTLPGLRYDVKLFTVRPGEAVELVFRNDDDMLHNLVITTPGSRIEVVQAAGMLGEEGPRRSYVPRMDEVLWSVPVVESGKSVTLEFRAPEAEGNYPFVCTYPGHGYVMYGTMGVTSEGALRVERNELDAVTPTHHEMSGRRPLVARGFMPDAGPASIAVHLGDGYSFCWDAGAVRFRYAWRGEFGEPVYRETMQLGGEVFYRERGGIPIRVGGDWEAAPREMEFLGYRFDGDDRLRFRYRVDGVEIEEMLFVEGGALKRRFEVSAEAAAGGVAFVVDEESEGAVESETKVENGVYLFSEDGVLEMTLLEEGKEHRHVH